MKIHKSPGKSQWKGVLQSFKTSVADDSGFEVSIAPQGITVVIQEQVTQWNLRESEIDYFTELHLHCFSWLSGGHAKVRAST